jgi:hypothetical protein
VPQLAGPQHCFLHVTRCPGAALQSELRQWANDPPDGAVLEQCEPVTSWGILVQGPDTVGDTQLYANEIFRSLTGDAPALLRRYP